MRLVAKCVIFVCGDEAKDACGLDQLCAGLEAGIEGEIHAACLLWQTHEADEERGFLLVHAKNAFNKGNRINMCWTVRYEWPCGARFTFNCVIGTGRSSWSEPAGSGHVLFIPSKEGVTRGDPLAMVTYGLSLLPLIRLLKKTIPDVHQPWYADDTGAGGKFKRIRLYFEKLQEFGPLRGYFPEPDKSILVVMAHTTQRKPKQALLALVFKLLLEADTLGASLGGRPTRRLG